MNDSNSIIITGASGYIGGTVARAYANAGYRVHAIVRPSSDVTRLINGTRITLHTYDGSYASLQAAVKKSAALTIVHAAACYAHPYKPEQLEQMLDANVRFGSMLLEAFAEAEGIDIIYSGSYWQHSFDSAYYPNSFYAASKSAFEQIMLYFAKHRGMRAISLKLGDVYGKSDRPMKLFSLLARAGESGELIKLTPGEQSMCLVHIDDVVAAFNIAQQLIQKKEIGFYGNYYVMGPTLSLKNVVNLYTKYAPHKINIEWGAVSYRPGQIMVPYQGTSLPGWKNSILLEEGIKDLLARN